MIPRYLIPALAFLFTTTRAQDYCTTAPTYSSIWEPTITFSESNPTVTPPLPCPAWYAVQEGYCCSNGFQCSGGSCTCPNGTLIYSLPLAPCVSQNPQWSGCPGNMMQGLCCSGPGIFVGGDYNGTWSTAACIGGGTAVFNVTTASDGTVGTTTLPPGISYTETRCFTCPLYTRTTSSSAFAARTMASEEIVVKIVAVGALLAAF